MTEKFTGTIRVFEDCDAPWWFVPVPAKISQPYKPLATNFGFIPVTLKVGKSSWPSSLLPSGDGTHCIAVPAKIRKAENIKLGDKLSIEFEIRER
ncbi:DUF1905 domain-containing protein [Candidatus Saccharibacteria bacterium]|nr:DUF1905 domain-containing protein [Candidatus Saccharibacteria bacterium]